MTRVHFYHNANERLTTAAAWLRDSWRQRQQVVVFAPEAAATYRLDQLLWSQPPTAFIPHCSIDSPLAAETPIVLADSLDRLPHDKFLLNLGDAPPPGFSRFETLIEIVGQDEADRQSARARFRHYRDRGYPIETSDLAAGTPPW